MGQNCIGIERFLVPEDACDALTELMRLRIAVLRCGSTLDETRFAGAHDPLAALILCHAHRADRVMVGGRWRVEDGNPVGIDLAKLIADQRQAARRFA